MIACVQAPVADLEKSLDWYKTAGFVRLPDEENVFVSDGKAVILLNPEPFARAGIVLFDDSGEEKLLAASSGTWVYRRRGQIPELPESPPQARLGNFQGVSIEAVDPVAEAGFWSALGLEKTAGDESQGWVLYSGLGFNVSVMGPNSCPHLFYNPGLTYFNSGRNPEIIAGMREAGIEITQELTCFNDKGEVDNVIIRDPAGLGFFIFND